MKLNVIAILFLLQVSYAYPQAHPDAIVKQRQLQKLWDFKESKAGHMYDVKHYELDLNVNPAVYGISGTVSTLFEMKESSNMVSFDLRGNMVVDSIKMDNLLLSYVHSDHIIQVTLPQMYNPSDLVSLSISYHGEPQSNGFGAFEQTTHNGSPVIWTLSEPYGAYTWWPCKQTLVDKADSVDIIVTTTLGNKVASNGVLVNTETLGNNVTYHWKHRHFIATYLIAIAVTNYDELQIEVPVPGQDPIQIIDYYYPESSGSWIANQQNVVNAMTAFNELFILYPFADEKYGHAQFGWGGGMEHQTMSFMYNNSEMLVVHELAHQWFGDYITCGSWADIWINEGFATYCEGLYLEHKYGADRFKTWRENEISDIVALPGGSVYCTDTSNVSSIFSGRLSYAKGGQVLHMLRLQVGNDAFFQGIRSYLNDPQLANGFARTADFQTHIEDAADSSLTEYFNDWIYGEGYPSYNIKWQASGENVYVKISQTPSHNSVSFFEMKIPIRFVAQNRDTIVWFHNTENEQIFSANINFVATYVSFDPNKDIVSKNNMVIQEDFVSIAQVVQNQCSIYPNPSVDGKVTIESDFEIIAVQAYTMIGEEVLSIDSNNFRNELMFSKGVYLLKITLFDNSVVMRKIVVQ